MVCIDVGKVQICVGDKVKAQIGSKVFIGVVDDISLFGDITLLDVFGNLVVFKPRNAKYIAKLTEDQWQKILERYQKK